jgi:NAD+ synthase
MSSLLEMDFSEAQKRICRFIKEYQENAGAKGIVLGLSGGIDSGTIAALSSLAIGGENVLGLILPERENFNQKDIDDAKVVATQFHLETQSVTCQSPSVALWGYSGFDQSDRLCKEMLKQEQG